MLAIAQNECFVSMVLSSKGAISVTSISNLDRNCGLRGLGSERWSDRAGIPFLSAPIVGSCLDRLTQKNSLARVYKRYTLLLTSLYFLCSIAYCRRAYGSLYQSTTFGNTIIASLGSKPKSCVTNSAQQSAIYTNISPRTLPDNIISIFLQSFILITYHNIFHRFICII